MKKESKNGSIFDTESKIERIEIGAEKQAYIRESKLRRKVKEFPP